MRERVVDTPTTQRLKAQKKLRQENYYAFRLDEDHVAAARRHALPDSSLLALSAIVAAGYGTRTAQWVTLPPRTLDCFARDWRWWHRATVKLEEAGLIECERHAGRMPRYRLAGKTRKATERPTP